jgi:hypothetical protein
MKLLIALVAAAAIALVVIGSSGCGVAHKIRERISGGPTSTPTLTRTPTPTPTVTPTPTPVPTPTPAIPPNPQGLLRWPAAPISFCVSDGGEGGYVPASVFVDTVQRAFDAWGIAWRNDGACGPPRQDDGVNEIGWGDLSGSASPGGRAYEAGLTQTTASTCTANCNENDKVRLTEADITIDTAPPREFRSRACLYTTMLHETGHFLGLDHLPAPAVMQAETSGCPDALTDADRAALLERYGPLVGG